MATVTWQFIVLVAALSASQVNCVPKFDNGGFVPSSMDYLEKSGKANDQIAEATQSLKSENSSRSLESNVSDRNQEPRFGFTNVGTTGSGYGVSPYGSGKVDLGGLILGAVIGVGTILIIPKLLYVISGSYGSYARSDEGGFVNSMTKLDDILARHGIDTTSCMQRAVCTYSKKAAETVRTANDIDDEEKVSSFDRMIEAITTNQVFHAAMRGTAIQEAVEAGRKGQNCVRMYRHCGFSMDSIIGLVSNVVSSMSGSESQPTAPAAS